MEIALFVGCLIASAFFSGSETALMAANRLQLRRLADDGDARAGRILGLVEDPRRLLAGLLVGNNIFNVLAASTLTSIFLERFDGSTGIALATAITTVLLVVFSEFLPKTLAALNPIAFARRVGGAVQWSLVALSPAVVPLEALTRPLGALLRGGGERFGLSDVRMAVAEGVRSGAVDPTMARVLQGGLSLEWKTVADVLVPRVDIVAVEASADLKNCRDVFRKEKFSRLLVQDGSPDTDVGYLAAKDLPLERAEREGWTASKSTREALRVLKSLPLPRLLARMRQSGVHFGVVKDEYGGTEGIVTLEDVLEELVGEIRDEHDADEVPPLLVLGKGAWMIRGDVSVKDLSDRLALKLEASDARTIGGLVAQELGRVPVQGDVVEVTGAKLIVEQVEERRVLQVRLEKLTTDSG